MNREAPRVPKCDRTDDDQPLHSGRGHGPPDRERRDLKVRIPLATLAALKQRALNDQCTLSGIAHAALEAYFEAFPEDVPPPARTAPRMTERIVAMGANPREPRELKVSLPAGAIVQLHARKVLFGQTIGATVADALTRHLEALRRGDGPR